MGVSEWVSKFITAEQLYRYITMSFIHWYCAVRRISHQNSLTHTDTHHTCPPKSTNRRGSREFAIKRNILLNNFCLLLSSVDLVILRRFYCACYRLEMRFANSYLSLLFSVFSLVRLFRILLTRNVRTKMFGQLLRISNSIRRRILNFGGRLETDTETTHLFCVVHARILFFFVPEECERAQSTIFCRHVIITFIYSSESMRIAAPQRWRIFIWIILFCGLVWACESSASTQYSLFGHVSFTLIIFNVHEGPNARAPHNKTVFYPINCARRGPVSLSLLLYAIPWVTEWISLTLGFRWRSFH